MGNSSSRTQRSTTGARILAIASSAIDRVGENSPAQILASDPALFRWFTVDLLGATRKIFAIGGRRDEGPTSALEIFNVPDKKWHNGPEMPNRRQAHGVASVGSRIFVIGGVVPGGATNSVLSLETRSGEWAEMPAMSEKRRRLGVAVVGTKIFALGGSNDTTILDSCEVFDVASGKWEPCAPIPTRRYEFGLAVVGNRIFVIGGLNDGHPVAALEVLDTTSGSWTALTPMVTPRCGMATAVIEDRFIYTFGGETSDSISDTIEVFDSEKGEWLIKTRTRMTSPRRGMKAAVTDGKVVLIGGSNFHTRRTSNTLKTVEIFDPEKQSWAKLPPMKRGRSAHAVVCL